MHELRFRNIIKCRLFLLHIYIYNCMFHRGIFINWLFALHKLFRGLFSGLDRINFVYGMYCRVILRHHGSDCSDGRLCCRLLLSRLGNRMFKLFSWNFPIYCKLIKLYSMFYRIILRHHGSVGSNGRLCSWKIFCRFIDSVFKLYCRLLYEYIKSIQLHELRAGLFFNDGDNFL